MDTTELSLRGQDHETESMMGTSPSSSPYSTYPGDLVLLLRFLFIHFLLISVHTFGLNLI